MDNNEHKWGTEIVSLIKQVIVPDLGGTFEVDVVEVLVKPGDIVSKKDGLITLEGDKASMEVPSPLTGTVKDIQVTVGNKVKEGDKILTLEIRTEGSQLVKKEKKVFKKSDNIIEEKRKQEPEIREIRWFSQEVVDELGASVYAGPAVRRIACEFGIDLTKINGTGQKGRILKEDVQNFVKKQLKVAEGKSNTGLLQLVPKIDFKKFGAVEEKLLSKIKKATGINLSRNWMIIPHVTQFGEADITELEIFRQSQKDYATKKGVRLTLLVFLIKTIVHALKEFPHFNASLDSTGEYLILKKYFHIGVAVDTSDGLVVPIIRDADKKGLFELAKELSDISEKARTKGLSLHDTQGGCFSVSSLGSIGGMAFTPIINAPEVAILGVSQMQWKLVCNKSNNCKARLMLPLSLSYDHRVIDGADGARFIVYLMKQLSDIRTLLL